MRLYCEPEKHAYDQLIDYVTERSDYFIVKVIDPNLANISSLKQLLHRLEPYLIRKQTLTEDMIRSSSMHPSYIYYTNGIYYSYRCCKETASLIKQFSKALSDWRLPQLPEDLCFVDKQGQELLYSVVHENMYGMNITDTEATALMGQIRGVCFKLQKHANLDELLHDIEYHQINALYISGHHLTEIPEGITNLHHLRSLEIFERDIEYLNEPLFRLKQLERLTLLCADLRTIPPEISKLSKLKHLSITCGSSDRTTREFKVKPKEQISLNVIPPEIGQLTNLQTLKLTYTAIAHIPIEIQQLQQLHTLELSLCMVEEVPAFLTEMKNLKNISITTKFPYSMVNIFE